MGTILKQKKGVALLWALIICLVMLIITGTMVGVIVKDSQSSVRIEESVQAYAAAKSGIDWGIWYINKKGDIPITSITHSIDVGRGKATVEIVISAGSPIIISSTGEVGAVRRKLRYESKPVTSCPVDPNLGTFIGTAGSFKMQFDFWMSAITGNDFTFGIANSSNDHLAMIVESGGKAKLHATVGSTVNETSLPIDGLSADSDDPYRYRAEIKYIQNISATLEIFERTIITLPNTETIEAYVSKGSQSINLVGTNLTNMNTLYIPSPPNHVHETNGTAGDGNYILINNYNYIAGGEHIKIFGLSACP